MKSLFKFQLITLCMGATFAYSAGAADKLFSAGLSVQEIWDSNFSRSPEEIDEQFTLASAYIGLDKQISKQRLMARWRGSSYRYQERSDLDANFQTGEVNWSGKWGNQLQSEFAWVRDAYAVDRLEFFDKDVVTRNDLKGKIGYGTGERLAFFIGGRQSTQYHSNELRKGLDFDEDEAFIETTYSTAQKSALILRLKNGERTYPNQPLNELARDLDFKYQQVELQGNWTLTPKTSVSALIASFARDGSLNEGRGALFSVEANWQPTSKLEFKTGGAYREPAIGEISEALTEVRSVFVSALWQFTDKISLSSRAAFEEQLYDTLDSELERKEELYSLAPLAIIFDSSERLSIRFDTEWIDRRSDLAYRDYSSTQVALGAVLRY